LFERKAAPYRRSRWQMGCTEAHMADMTQTATGGARPMPKVMVVDDAYSELQVMETILRSAGYEVVTYLDGDELEEKIVKERPDVVLLDIVMPKRNGFEALRGVRRDERTRQARVVVVSSKNQESDRVWGMRQGADEYLAKPFTADQLLALVRRFLR
jgi:DNA-binding response OmpR family regulator